MEMQIINNTISSSNELLQGTNNTLLNNDSSIISTLNQIAHSLSKQTFTQCDNKENIRADSYFAGTIKPKGPGKKEINGVFKILSKGFRGKKCINTKVQHSDGNIYNVSPEAITFLKHYEATNLIKNHLNDFKKDNSSSTTTKETNAKPKAKVLTITNKFNSLTTEDKIKTLINLNIKNIWLVGPAGCGKSTITRNIAKELDIPYYCISCGVGTSATEFVGYKYPQREATKFADYYSKKSIILIDEMTALDPSVAQILNSALANDEIETTTGLVKRHPECIIIATSNTFGNGADRQYVANNQLDTSTIDRFIGGIIEVNYSEEFESQYDKEVVAYINWLRHKIKEQHLRRVCSTRMIQNISKLKTSGYSDWKELCTLNWTDSEKALLNEQHQSFEINYAS